MHLPREKLTFFTETLRVAMVSIFVDTYARVKLVYVHSRVNNTECTSFLLTNHSFLGSAIYSSEDVKRSTVTLSKLFCPNSFVYFSRGWHVIRLLRIIQSINTVYAIIVKKHVT